MKNEFFHVVYLVNKENNEIENFKKSFCIIPKNKVEFEFKIVLKWVLNKNTEYMIKIFFIKC